MTLVYWLIGLLILICAYFIYKRRASYKNYFKEMGIAYIEPKLLLGNTGDLFWKRHSMPAYIQSMYKQFPNERLFGFFEFGQPMVMLRDPELIKQITIKDFEYFEDHSTFFEQNSDRLLGNSLVMLKGKKWREMRATLSPSFTGSKMRLMSDMITDSGDVTTDYLLKQTENKTGKISWEMREFFMRYSNDVIASCAFGIKVNSLADPNNAFLENGREVLKTTSPKFLIKLALTKIMPKFMKFFFTGIFGEKVHSFFRSMVLDTMSVRKKQNIYRPDMINILMQVQKEGAEMKEEAYGNGDVTPVKRIWTEDEIVAQCFVFYSAGFNSIAAALSFLAYEIAINPDVQQTLYNEICEVERKLNGDQIQYHNLKEMKYLDQVIQEALRKWSPGVMIDRICVKDYVVDDVDGKSITIKKGTFLWLPVYAIHHDPQYHPDPYKFDPSRFSEENKSKIQSGTFFPFGMGPRNCIASRFALTEIKLITYKLLLNFSIEPNSNTQIPVQYKKSTAGVVAEKGIHLDFKRRIKN